MTLSHFYSVLVPKLLVLYALLSNAGMVYAGDDSSILRVSVSKAAMESGLVQALAKKFEKKHPGTDIKFKTAGAFEAVEFARLGLADLTLTHHEPAEKRLVVQEVGVNRTQVFYSNYALLGPPSAATEISTQKNLLAVLRVLAQKEVLFLEPSPRGGTYRRVREIWAAAGINPNWLGYENTGTSAVGALWQAAELDAYTITEISTYLRHRDELKNKLVLLYTNDHLLRSIFSAVIVNEDKVKGINQQLAEKFVSFLVSVEGQKYIQMYNDKMFNVSVLSPAAHLDNNFLKRKAEEKLLDETWNVRVLTVLSLALFCMFIFSIFLFFRFRKVNTKRLEMEKRSNTNLRARIDAENASKAKSGFLANMSHEMRTPLTAIIGYAEILKAEKLDEKHHSLYLKTILNSGNHLLNLINDILDLSKIEAEKLEIEVIEVEVMSLLSDVKSFLKTQAAKKDISVFINPALPLPRHIKSDPVRLKQILINLCSNAVKFTSQGSIQINVNCDINDQMMEFDVVDTGIGIKAKDLKNIFNAFTQADTTTTRKYGGTGLGLSLSKQLAKKLGGDIEVNSLVDIGSRFILSVSTGDLKGVELVYGKKMEIVGVTDEFSEDKTIETTRGHVLLAEDVGENIKLVTFYLKKLGLNVTAVENGKLAVEAIAKEKFDMVLMDLQMPVMGGVEAIKLMRERGFMKPILALTANAMKEDKETCYKVGCDGFLTKPFEGAAFMSVIGKYLSEK